MVVVLPVERERTSIYGLSSPYTTSFKPSVFEGSLRPKTQVVLVSFPPSPKEASSLTTFITQRGLGTVSTSLLQDAIFSPPYRPLLLLKCRR